MVMNAVAEDEASLLKLIEKVREGDGIKKVQLLYYEKVEDMVNG